MFFEASRRHCLCNNVIGGPVIIINRELAPTKLEQTRRSTQSSHQPNATQVFCLKQYMKHTHSQTQPACAISFKTLSHMMIQETQRISNKQNRSLIHLETQLLHGAIIQLNCGVPIFPAYDFDRLWSFFETVIHTYYLPGDLYPRFLYSVDMILELRSVPGLLVLLCIADKVDKGSFQNDFNRTWESRARSPYTHPHSTLKNRGKAKPNTHITLSPTLPPPFANILTFQSV